LTTLIPASRPERPHWPSDFPKAPTSARTECKLLPRLPAFAD